jgi:hypothetical protein
MGTCFVCRTNGPHQTCHGVNEPAVNLGAEYCFKAPVCANGQIPPTTLKVPCSLAIVRGFISKPCGTPTH